MAIRTGRFTITLPSRPVVQGFAAVAGKKEGEGPLAAEFDHIFDDTTLGEVSWEKAESKLHREAVIRALSKAQKSPADVDVIFAGDLLSQCIGTCFGIRELDMPFAGLYGACSTMALSLLMASVFIDTGTAGLAVASTSSHFCSAENNSACRWNTAASARPPHSGQQRRPARQCLLPREKGRAWNRLLSGKCRISALKMQTIWAQPWRRRPARPLPLSCMIPAQYRRITI